MAQTKFTHLHTRTSTDTYLIINSFKYGWQHFVWEEGYIQHLPKVGESRYSNLRCHKAGRYNGKPLTCAKKDFYKTAKWWWKAKMRLESKV